MSEQVSPEIKEKRSKKIISLSDEIQQNYNKLYIGKTVNVLVEERDNEYYKGHTENYIFVYIKCSEKNIENKIVKVKIEKIENENILGKLA